MATPTRQLVDRQLADAKSEPTAKLIKKGRKAGDSWGTIAIQIGQLTGNWLTGETIRRWGRADGLTTDSAA